MSTAGELRLVEESARGKRRRRVPQAAALGGYYLEYTKAGPGERRHAGLAVARQNGDRRRLVAGIVACRDQNRTATSATDLAPPRRTRLELGVGLRERSSEPSNRPASRSSPDRACRFQDFPP